MTLGFKFFPFPTFQPGETVLYCQPWVRALSCKSPPSYRLFFSLPPLTEMAMYVTDRRIFLIDCFLRLLPQEFSVWFSRGPQGEEREMFKSVSTGRVHWSGNYLELISEDLQTHWYRSRELRLRLFLRNPEPLRQLISETAGKGL
jgi:hypothetical protein